MTRTLTSLRATPSRRSRASRPALEGLEDRKLLYATLGCQWVYASRITYSFVPDGTNVGGVSSSLYSTLNTVAPTTTWQAAIEKAAAIWSSYANINLAQVSDSGAAIGTPGNQQDDARFGDIRIAMIPQSSGALAFTLLPPPYNGGTAAGDIVFNTNVAWKVNSNIDLETVALHEFGHALGMDHSAVTTAVMYAYYNNIKQNLVSDDVSGIQSIYGAYPNDPINNGSFATAQNITGLINGNAQIALPNQSLAGTSDNDFFVVTVPANTTGSMTVSMQTTNLSSGSPDVIIYNSNHTLAGFTSLPNSFGATATYTVTGVTPGQTYYIRALAASPLGSYGAFGLLVNFGSSPQAPIPPPNTVVLQQPDQGGGSINQNPLTFASQNGLTASVQKIQLGNWTGLGSVLMVGAGAGGRLDPNGLSIPISPGGMTNAQVMGYQLVDAALATSDVAIPPPSQPVANLFASIQNSLSQWLIALTSNNQSVWS
jgi:hypothetical protein